MKSLLTYRFIPRLNKRYELSYVFVTILVVCSVLWMSAITPLSPFYLCVIPIGFFPFYYKYRNRSLSERFSKYLAYFSCFLFAIYLLIQPAFTDSTIHNNVVLAFCMCFYPLADSILNTVEKKENVKSFVKILALVTIVYMVADFCKRYFEADWNNVPTWIQASPIFKFYMFKGIGLHGDSNNSAAIALTVSMFVYFFIKECNKKDKSLKVIFMVLFIVTLATMSRAAVIAFFLQIFFYNFFYKKNVFIRFFELFVVIVFAVLLIYFLSIDPSGKTKIDIFVKTLDYFFAEDNPVKFLFGYGGNNSSQILGRYAHNPISVYFIEYGLIGFCLYYLLLLFICLDVGLFSLFLVIPFGIFAMSFAPLHITYFFISLSLIKQSARLYNLKWGK